MNMKLKGNIQKTAERKHPIYAKQEKRETVQKYWTFSKYVSRGWKLKQLPKSLAIIVSPLWSKYKNTNKCQGREKWFLVNSNKKRGSGELRGRCKWDIWS